MYKKFLRTTIIVGITLGCLFTTSNAVERDLLSNAVYENEKSLETPRREGHTWQWGEACHGYKRYQNLEVEKCEYQGDPCNGVVRRLDGVPSLNAQGQIDFSKLKAGKWGHAWGLGISWNFHDFVPSEGARAAWQKLAEYRALKAELKGRLSPSLSESETKAAVEDGRVRRIQERFAKK